ncbi:MAG: cell wall hydrolase [Aestuariivita sp.]|nr:cell wall hydrolase [Aestuariivita sp.]MCY4201761.1 cell wall hydrolase [Aestuariivita sp.]MCY4289415.1 cell wall hydrolase [Aestuariivita sp.]MCY4346640.1 cell wall hydrolase [Aestuariivita sp.]
MRHFLSGILAGATVFFSVVYADVTNDFGITGKPIVYSLAPGVRPHDFSHDYLPQASLDIFTDEWIDSRPQAIGGDEWQCLTQAIYFEARGESIKGQFAVGEVILNRVSNLRFPSSICGVVHQGTGKRYQCQFTYMCDGYKETIHDRQAYERVGKAARALLDGYHQLGVTVGATHYHTTDVSPRWSRVYTRTTRIGRHVFYRQTSRTADSSLPNY